MEKRLKIRRIYWYCLDMSDSSKKFVSDALRELSDKLKQPPTEVAIMTEELPDKHAEKVSQLLCGSENISCTAASISYIIVNGLELLPGLMVYCREDSTIAQEVRKANPKALWGGQVDGLAVVCELNNKMAIWHEVLHLLGADDCYDSQTEKGTCEKAPGCIMQYAATEESVADWPECLCARTTKQLRDYARRQFSS